MKIFSYDIESSTGSHNDGSMCTFGYCIADENFSISKQEDIVMKPKTKRFEPRIKLHYPKETIINSPPFPYHYEKIKNLFSGNDYVIGFSVINDVSFLNDACNQYGLEKITYSFLDVQLLHKKVFNKPTVFGLEAIAEELGVEYEAHRSDEDARLTLILLKHICESLNMSIEEILNTYSVTLGENLEKETVPCQDGTLSKAEKKYLIHIFKEKHYRHSYFYKGGLSKKNFAFTEEIMFSDVIYYRRILGTIFSLNGKVSDADSCNVYVTNNFEKDKNRARIEERNKNRKRVKVVSEKELLELLGELKDFDFSNDKQMIKIRRREIRKQRELKRLEKIKNLNNENSKTSVSK